MEVTEILQYTGVGGGSAGAAVFIQWKINQMINKKQDEDIDQLKKDYKELRETQLNLRDEIRDNTAEDKLTRKDVEILQEKLKNHGRSTGKH